MEKVALLKQMPHYWLQEQTKVVCSPELLPYAGLLSSFTTLQNHVILCDMGTYLTGFSFPLQNEFVLYFVYNTQLLISTHVILKLDRGF